MCSLFLVLLAVFLLTSCKKEVYIRDGFGGGASFQCKDGKILLKLQSTSRKSSASLNRNLMLAIAAVCIDKSVDDISRAPNKATFEIEEKYKTMFDGEEIYNTVILSFEREKIAEKKAPKVKKDAKYKVVWLYDEKFRSEFPTKDDHININAIFEIAGVDHSLSWFQDEERAKVKSIISKVIAKERSLDLSENIPQTCREIERLFNETYANDLKIKNFVFTEFELSKEIKALKIELEKSRQEVEIVANQIRRDSLISISAKRDAVGYDRESEKLEIRRDNRQASIENRKSAERIENRKALSHEQAAENLGILRSLHIND